MGRDIENELKEGRLFIISYAPMAKYTLSHRLKRTTNEIIHYKRPIIVQGIEKPIVVLWQGWEMVYNVRELIEAALLRRGLILDADFNDITEKWKKK